MRTAAGQASQTGAIPLESNPTILDEYYRGLRLRSPMGGNLDMIGSRGLDDGSAAVILECTTSSLRFELIVPAATDPEASEVSRQMDVGEDPFCPRCGPTRPLLLSGPRWVCRCGVGFADSR